MENERENDNFSKFKKSVETSLKSFASKLGESLKDLRKQIKQIKEELENKENKECKNCSCNKETENLKTTLKVLETKVCTLTENFHNESGHSTNLDSDILKLQELSTINKQKIEDIDLKLQSLESKKDKETTKSCESSALPSENVTCKQCGLQLSGLESLNEHILQKHKRIFKCSDCARTFNNSYELEQHIVNMHNKVKPFKCDKCEVKFLMKWRFDKHIAAHESLKTRRCHYFNNKKECPFVKSGCKYLHETSKICKYLDSCSTAMCQFRH